MIPSQGKDSGSSDSRKTFIILTFLLRYFFIFFFALFHLSVLVVDFNGTMKSN